MCYTSIISSVEWQRHPVWWKSFVGGHRRRGDDLKAFSVGRRGDRNRDAALDCVRQSRTQDPTRDVHHFRRTLPVHVATVLHYHPFVQGGKESRGNDFAPGLRAGTLSWHGVNAQQEVGSIIQREEWVHSVLFSRVGDEVRLVCS